jgi:dienelactone hydrolase
VFEYFPDNYNWSLATALAIGMGGELTEIDAACRSLRPEFLLLLGVDDWTARGISVLICDHPGSGEALRLHGLVARLDTEVAASACIDHLAGRADVDPTRIGITGISMGGYYAPRAAAFEHRLAACAAWGAFHDLSGVLANLERTGAHSAPPFQGPWVFGITEPDARADLLSAKTLDETAAEISCPLLVLHGESDRQVPVEQARRTLAGATNAAKRELRVIAAGEPGDQHCQMDLPSIAIDIVGDWFEEVLA